MENEKDKENEKRNLMDIYKKGNVLDGALSSNIYLAFSKKTEKIVTAIFMVTSFIKDNEIIKRQIRNESIFMLSDMISCAKLSLQDQVSTLQSIIFSIEHTLSLLSVAYRVQFISEMNFGILERELKALEKQLEQILSTRSALFDEGTSEDPVIPEDLFDNTPLRIEDFPQKPSVAPKSLPSKERVVTNTSSHEKGHDKDGRKERVLEIIKEKQKVSIKDIAIRITNCSEKTIQRDLIQLVKEGLIKKEGNKRWSMYIFIKDM